ncbi:ribonuclease PH [Synechococcus sp. RSCCF101]|uniref:ribonuclease PH n=1 Tax=Synechococcus sp. RSCCF101 TaxID=2511069 RepID=UPI00124674A2|nr:ribonuclease PH [Synechococcus sp. RSCCF101]QEY32262.1 ribonuclease PH [Synechococcus sp. RSCCF101]
MPPSAESRPEAAAGSGPRADGRAFDALRPMRVRWDPMGFALSSLTIHSGRTVVLCSCCMEEGVPGWRKGSGLGWLSAEYRLLPASTPQRQRRETLKLSGRTQEIQRLIGRSLRAAIDLAVLGERTLLIDCDVIQADAGTRTASVTGAWLALARALQRLEADGLLTGPARLRQIAAVSVGLVGGAALLDLDYSEDSRADVDLNVVMTQDLDLVELQGTGEGTCFPRRELDALLSLAEGGIRTLLQGQRDALATADRPEGVRSEHRS